jgi:hypothetical protein
VGSGGGGQRDGSWRFIGFSIVSASDAHAEFQCLFAEACGLDNEARHSFALADFGKNCAAGKEMSSGKLQR